ncbi:DUF6886 family protein [Winogradskya humida]|uniref:Alpha/beta hydrolase family protein n=1 Tax=Winogradskya humida TaxID=113566 RepID=A0ABQ3ZGP2_9ACTN|nr:DUF6886 family protein [Actinoplanes humidus]GIE17749.1 hypothetical protein Ahu01nite_008510 [Actinoplanes humidus]
MRPGPGEVLHFSQDATIERFVPQPGAFVWAVDHDRAPDYWFPRECPRAMAWTVGTTTDADRERIIGAGSGTRVHAVEYAWLETIRTVRLYAYRFPAAPFRPLPDPHAVVTTGAVDPLGPPELVGNLFDLHEQAGIQLRVLPSLWPFWHSVTASTLGFSAIRLRNAKPPTALAP